MTAKSLARLFIFRERALGLSLGDMLDDAKRARAEKTRRRRRRRARAGKKSREKSRK